MLVLNKTKTLQESLREPLTTPFGNTFTEGATKLFKLFEVGFYYMLYTIFVLYVTKINSGVYTVLYDIVHTASISTCMHVFTYSAFVPSDVGLPCGKIFARMKGSYWWNEWPN